MNYRPSHRQERVRQMHAPNRLYRQSIHRTQRNHTRYRYSARSRSRGLGIRLSYFLTLRRPLQYQDLVVLEMISVESSNGTVVSQQFDDLAKQVGNPLAILSDSGSDLNKGVTLFQAAAGWHCRQYSRSRMENASIEHERSRDTARGSRRNARVTRYRPPSSR